MAADAISPHTPISNQPEMFIATNPAVEDPFAGEPPEGVPDGEVEAVARPQLESMSDPWTAPDQEGLRDIAEASFGPPPGLETVHGPDNRVKIPQPETHPWRMHASLGIVAADGSPWIGTGWFIGPHTLATAGHCVYITNSGVPGRDGWVRSISVMPGRNASALPFGSVTSSSFRTVRGWADTGDEHFDYGAIILPVDLGQQVGWFGFAVDTDEDLRATTVNISGYPGDKPPGTLWYDSHAVASVGPSKVFYDIDTFGGQSGSAVYRIKNGLRHAVAVHAYGGATTNSGTRISTPVFSNFMAWKA